MTNSQLLKAFNQLEELITFIEKDLGIVTVDLAQLSTVPYYTGMMFKVLINRYRMPSYLEGDMINYLSDLVLRN